MLRSTTTLLALAALSLPAEAALFRCADANGNVSYQERPCPDNTKDKKQLSDIPDWAPIGGEASDRGYEYQYDQNSVRNVGKVKKVKIRRIAGAVRHGRGGNEQISTWYIDCRNRSLFMVGGGSDEDDKAALKRQEQDANAHLPTADDDSSHRYFRSPSYRDTYYYDSGQARAVAGKICRR